MRPGLTALLCLPCLLLAAVSASALETDLQLGQSSFKFLKSPLSPRSTALGGSGAALGDGVGEAEVNPAAPARSGAALVLGQEYPPQQFGTTGSHISWSLPWGPRRIVLHTRYLGFEKIPGWDDDNNSTTAYGAYTLKLQGGLAGNNLGFGWGAGLAFAQNSVAEATYGAALVNAGLQRAFRGGLSGLSAGASVMNADLWTGSNKPAGEPVSAPLTLQGGLAYTRALKTGSGLGHMLGTSVRLSAAADARKVNDEDLVFPVGVEAGIGEGLVKDGMLFLRAGYPVADPDNGLTLGLGVQWSRFGFSYAYKGHSTLSGGHGWALEIRD
jgi:hypothetical protein